MKKTFNTVLVLSVLKTVNQIQPDLPEPTRPYRSRNPADYATRNPSVKFSPHISSPFSPRIPLTTCFRIIQPKCATNIKHPWLCAAITTPCSPVSAVNSSADYPQEFPRPVFQNCLPKCPIIKWRPVTVCHRYKSVWFSPQFSPSSADHSRKILPSESCGAKK